MECYCFAPSNWLVLERAQHKFNKLLLLCKPQYHQLPFLRNALNI